MKRILKFESFTPKNHADRKDKAAEIGLVIYPKLPYLNVEPFGECCWIFRREEDHCAITLWDKKFSVLFSKLKLSMASRETIKYLEFETGRNFKVDVNIIKFSDIKHAEEVFDFMAKRWFMEPFMQSLENYNFSEEDIRLKTKELLKEAKKLKLQMLDLAKKQGLIN